MSDSEFCFRACKDGPRAPALCEHIYDVMGCAWNMPANYNAGTFEKCAADSGEPMGVYGSSTFHQGDPVTPAAHPAPSSSQCTTLTTIANNVHVGSGLSSAVTSVSTSSPVSSSGSASSVTASSSSSLSSASASASASASLPSSSRAPGSVTGSRSVCAWCYSVTLIISIHMIAFSIIVIILSSRFTVLCILFHTVLLTNVSSIDNCSHFRKLGFPHWKWK